MADLIPTDVATQEQIDAFVTSLRADARKHVREQLASGASSDEIAEYVASLEPPSADVVMPDAEDP